MDKGVGGEKDDRKINIRASQHTDIPSTHTHKPAAKEGLYSLPPSSLPESREDKKTISHIHQLCAAAAAAAATTLPLGLVSEFVDQGCHGVLAVREQSTDGRAHPGHHRQSIEGGKEGGREGELRKRMTGKNKVARCLRLSRCVSSLPPTLNTYRPLLISLFVYLRASSSVLSSNLGKAEVSGWTFPGLLSSFWGARISRAEQKIRTCAQPWVAQAPEVMALMP